MSFNQDEVKSLFEIVKNPCSSIAIEFPTQGQYIEIELQNDTGRIKFQADINRGNKIITKLTLQLRHKKIYTIRRLDFYGNHKNPPAPIPDEMFNGYDDYVFKGQDHVHFYIEGYGDRWALPLSEIPEIGIESADDVYEKMLKFFQYCNVQDLEFKVTKNLIF